QRAHRLGSHLLRLRLRLIGAGHRAGACRPSQRLTVRLALGDALVGLGLLLLFFGRVGGALLVFFLLLVGFGLLLLVFGVGFFLRLRGGLLEGALFFVGALLLVGLGLFLHPLLFGEALLLLGLHLLALGLQTLFLLEAFLLFFGEALLVGGRFVLGLLGVFLLLRLLGFGVRFGLGVGVGPGLGGGLVFFALLGRF